MTLPLVILCFHRILPESHCVGPDKPYFLRQTALSLERFRLLLDEIESHAHVLPPEALFEWLKGAQVTDRPGVVLTFDDGYADIVTFALPELQRRHSRAIVCITTATMFEDYTLPVDRWYATIHAAMVRRGTLSGLGVEPWTFDLDRDEDFARLIDGPEKRAFVQANAVEQEKLLQCLERAFGVHTRPPVPKMLDVEQLRMLEERGFILGAHGHHHLHLPRLSDEIASYELERSHSFFPNHGLSTTPILAYPDGATSGRIEELARAQGFSVGLALGSRPATRDDSPLHLPRFIPTNDPSWFTRRLLPLFTSGER